MTDQVTEQTEAEPEAAELVFPDEMSRVSFNTISELIKERNSLVAKSNAVKGDRQTLSEQLEENSTNPDAVEARQRRDAAQDALDEAIMALHKAIQPEIEAVMADAEGASKQIEENIKELDGKIKPAQNFFKKMYGEAMAKALPNLERLRGFSTRGAGSSGRRVRGYSADVVIEGESTAFDNLASAAKYLGVETTALQEAFFSAAGNPEKLKDAPDRVDFEVQYVDTDDQGNSETLTARVIATRDAKDEGTDEEPENSDEGDE